jgi:uncharacterized integral membrane protein
MNRRRKVPSGLKGGLIMVLTGLLIVFAIQNVATVEVNFLIWDLQLPRAVLYFGIFAIGMFIGWLTRFFGTHDRGCT